MTRKEKFFEIFPEVSRYGDNIPIISPCWLYKNLEGEHCENKICYLCRKEFWNHELDEGESFMNF